MVDEIHQLLDRIDFGVPVGRDGVLAFGNAPDLRDLPGDLGARQDPALAGLGPLAELDLEHAHLLVAGEFPQPVVAEPAVGGAYAVLESRTGRTPGLGRRGG